MTRAWPFVALLASLASAGEAQERVRVHASRVWSAPIIGRQAPADSNRMGIQVTPRGTALLVPGAIVDSMHWSAGRDRGVGMRRGALAGAGLGVLAFASLYPEIRGQDPFGLGRLALIVVSGVILPGAGAVVGLVFSPERWKALDFARLGNSPTSNRVVLHFAPGEFVYVRTRTASYSGTTATEPGDAFSVVDASGAHLVRWSDVVSIRARGGKDRVRGSIYGALVGIGVGVLGEQSAPTTSAGERIGAFASSALVFGFLGSRFLAPRGWTSLPIPARP